MSGLFSLTITVFLSAFLLFQVQPLISRYILPWFGGTPAVWSASLLFFQVLLLGGYGYAHWLSARAKVQMAFHQVLLAGSVLILLVTSLAWGVPLLPGSSWKPPDASVPLLRIVMVLLVGVGLPYFILSTTSPLLQSWFKFLYPQRTPYGLYALSNFASLLALISYPVIFEPVLALREQSKIWSLAYGFYVAGCIYLAFKVRSISKDNPSSRTENIPESPPPAEPPRPSLSRKLFWISLPACSSILLLSITNQLTQEVAVIPFLWVLPLSVYLFTFTITFSGERWYRRTFSLVFLAVATLFVWYALERVASIGVFPQIVIYSFFLLIATLVCHGELYRLRPDPEQLTSFYLMVSLGGAVGGLFVNLAAPLIFKGYWELQVGVLLGWILVFLLLVADQKSVFHRRWVWLAVPLILLVIGGTGFYYYKQIRNTLAGAVEVKRNFYGVFRVRLISAGNPPEDAYSLSHGITSHGFQYLSLEKRNIPTTYYGRKSGIGLAIAHYSQSLGIDPPGQGLRVGVIGLGTGTLASYGKRGDYYRFYEINPDIIDLALGKNGFYTYLKDTQASIDIIPGDARISLEHELERGQPQNFDILAVDAFNSDSIPVHLLTAEAFGLYLRHLKPEGVLAMHISNRYLNLAPLVSGLADLYHLDHALIASPSNDDGSYAAVWVLLSKNRSFFQIPEIADRIDTSRESGNPVRVWTDDYSNLLPFVRVDVFFNPR